MTLVKAQSWNGDHLGLGSEACIHVAPPATDLSAISRTAGIAFHAVPGTKVTSKQTLMEQISKSLHFPDWFGKNWDALADSLRDLSWVRSPGYLLVFQDSDVFARAAPKDFKTFVQVLGDVCRDWRQWEVPFHVVFVGPPEMAKVLAGATAAPICLHEGE